MRLNDLLPKTYEYRDLEIEIDLTFDNVLDLFDVIGLKELSEFHRAELCLVLLFGDGVIEPEDTVEVWNDVFDRFLDSTKEEVVQYDIAGNKMPTKASEPLIDLDQDAEFLYSSFIQAYGINLIQVQGKLHWYEFKALLTG